MSKFLSFPFLLVLATLCCGSGSSDCISKDGYFRGVKLAGKVRIVEHGADFKVRVVEHGEDLKVKVSQYASQTDGAGRWRFVQYGADFKIRFVEYGGDFKIRFDEVSYGVSHPCKE